MHRLWILVAISVASMCGAQVTGAFSLDKSIFAPGEPVFLNLTVSNEGKESQEVLTADPYSFCSGYTIQVERQGSQHVSCSQGYAGSCVSGGVTLAPHASRTERILLNYRNESRGDPGPSLSVPGQYTIDAVRKISFGTLGPISRLFENAHDSEVHQVFAFRVDDGLDLPPSTYASFVQQLTSPNGELRREAARTLATLAPATLEPLLLTFATSKDDVLRQFAPLALANLSTEASLSALAEMLVHTEPGTYESMSAAEYLGRTHDPKWFPMLLAVADKQGSMYLVYAAESGGDSAVPALLSRMRSTESGVRSSALYALGNTGSRAAVPFLIGVLKTSGTANADDSQDDAITANAALQQLTHRYVERDAAGQVDEGQRRIWQQWWLAAGPDAKIYKSDECGPFIDLP